MGKLQPTSSNAKLEPAPSWDADPSSPPPANATNDPPLPDSLPTHQPQNRDANSNDDEKTSTSPLPSPKPTIPPPPPLPSQAKPEPSMPLPPMTLHHPDDIESMQAVFFPPAPLVAVATAPGNEIVPYVPPENFSNKQETGQHGPGFGLGPAATRPHGAPGAQVNSHEAASWPGVMFPPHEADNKAAFRPAPEVNNNDNVPAAAAPLALVARSSRLQPEGPTVILVPFVGVPWKSGIFDCCQHPTNAIMTTVAPCVTFGQIAEILDNGSTSCLTGAFLYFFLFLVLCHWNVGVRYRKRIRDAFQIADTPVTDRIAHTLCPLCSLCQEFRELKYRGLDPFLGYQGVIADILHEQRQQGEGNIPPPNQISETLVTDRLAHILCPLCSLCQEFRELKYRGLDPFLGYQGVIAGILHEQRQQGEGNIPPPNQVMMR
ncbi:uncharacterized protein LOC115684218 [Syzygium oleosum]|uniref:uncharacterized protein LOC115684218 n=1 Tax=Syzygium oleosum TaxID=219896 RepID=UPI0024B93396|nr:uncharacterized protein LOC115684218 [Syzygium oleosum]